MKSPLGRCHALGGFNPAGKASMIESAAKTIHLVKAVEKAGDTDFWNAEDANWATHGAAHVVGANATAEKFVAVRARLASERLFERRPEFRRLLGRTVARPWLGWLLVVLALFSGILIDQIGLEKRINLLAIPVFGLLLWNLAIYLWLLLQALPRLFFGGRPIASRVARWIAGIGRSGAETLAMPSIPAAFVQSWSQASLPLAGARIARFMHLAAAAFGLGVIASLYFRGVIHDYRVGWESTFLDADQLHAFLGFLFAGMPAALAPAMPDLATLEAMRFPASAGADAAPWIHRIAGLLLLVVVLPRLGLALLAGWRQGWLEGHFPVDLSEPYFQRLLGHFRNEAARVAVLPYSTSLTPQAALRLQQAVQRLFGAQSEVLLAEPVPFGGEDGLSMVAGEANLRLVIFSLAATPEVEHHGALLQKLRAERLLVLVDESAFLLRFASQPERLAERRKLWSSFLQAIPVPHVLADLDNPDSELLHAQLDTCLGDTGGEA
jgi:hypothetical protein